MTTIRLPTATRGRRSAAAQARYDGEVRAFCRALVELDSRLDFRVSTRGWCYILEEHGLPKGDFDRAERLITQCRKAGLLPLDITAEDESRTTIGLIAIDDEPPREYGRSLLTSALAWVDAYTLRDFWDAQPMYVEVVVEKADLRNLFVPVCAACFVPLTSLKGWADVTSRAHLMRRMQAREAKGQRCVLLTCTDLDPGGIQIAGFVRANLAELTPAVGWDPAGLAIERFGLTAEFVRRHRLTWIDGLETGSGKRLDDPAHPDHEKSYVQDYLREYGPRKVEANALVVRPAAGRALCQSAIERYVSPDAVAAHTAALAQDREDLRRWMPGIVRQFARTLTRTGG
jgi:hypothetical protein